MRNLGEELLKVQSLAAEVSGRATGHSSPQMCRTGHANHRTESRGTNEWTYSGGSNRLCQGVWTPMN